MTQVELADKIGITQSFITSYERNRLRLHPEMLMRFAIALDVATDDILGFNTKGSEPTLSLKIVRRMRRIADLNPSKQKALLQIIDGFLNRQIQALIKFPQYHMQSSTTPNSS